MNSNTLATPEVSAARPATTCCHRRLDDGSRAQPTPAQIPSRGNVDDGCVLCRGGGKSDGYRAATRVGSAVAPRNPYAHNNTNKVAPTATGALVRNPAIRARYPRAAQSWLVVSRRWPAPCSTSGWRWVVKRSVSSALRTCCIASASEGRRGLGAMLMKACHALGRGSGRRRSVAGGLHRSRRLRRIAQDRAH